MNKINFINTVRLLGSLIKGTQFENVTYVVGGAVRDLYLGNEIKDIDIVVELKNGGIELAAFLTEKYSTHSPIIYPTYGTAKFILDKIESLKDKEFESVMTRKEWYNEGSRKPSEVNFGTIEEDAKRRDLTINALYLNVSTFKILDPTCFGKYDLNNKILRTTDNAKQVFKDDPLRMLRVCRFSGILDYNIETKTYYEIISCSHLLNNISKERINDELTKMLKSDNSDKCINLLWRLFLLKEIFPKLENEVKALKISLQILPNIKYGFVEKLAALFSGLIISNKTNIIFVQLYLAKYKFSNEIIQKVMLLLTNIDLLDRYGNKCENISNKSIRKILFTLKDNVDMVLNFIKTINQSIQFKKGDKSSQVDAFINRVNILKSNGENCNGDMSLPINGNDIMSELHIKSGPLVKYYLDLCKEYYFINPEYDKNSYLRLIKNHHEKLLEIKQI